MPAVAISAILNHLQANIGLMRSVTPWRSCSIRLFTYFDDHTFATAGNWPSVFISRAARCDAAQPFYVMVRGVDPWLLMALRKNALAAPTSRLPLSRKSTVLPVRSTAGHSYTKLPRLMT